VTQIAMAKVRPKKHLGQHFLRDEQIAHQIVAGLKLESSQHILEIGPGMGILTSLLLEIPEQQLWVIDIDGESIDYLQKKFPQLKDRIILGDFLRKNLQEISTDKISLIGNLPYNISSQIFFRLLELKDSVPEMVCMIQKEVAQRIASPPGNKTYGILSVLLGAFFNIEYLFAVEPAAFNPPPKVESAVIRLTRNDTKQLECDEKLFFRVVKQGFQNRRKTLRNALKPLNLPEQINDHPFLSLRAEQLGVADFVALTSKIEVMWKSN
jgi:16S rRNA (adenine1518-N6/adenine1519-N6)-dimethyltransferase